MSTTAWQQWPLVTVACVMHCNCASCLTLTMFLSVQASSTRIIYVHHSMAAVASGDSSYRIGPLSCKLSQWMLKRTSFDSASCQTSTQVLFGSECILALGRGKEGQQRPYRQVLQVSLRKKRLGMLAFEIPVVHKIKRSQMQSLSSILDAFNCHVYFLRP